MARRPKGTTRPDADENLDQWRALYETFKVDDGKDRVPPPTAEDLDRFEAETGIRLPAGYRGYIGVFGPGCLTVGSGNSAREMFIQSPYCPKRSLDLGKAVERLRILKDSPPLGMDEQTRRTIVFARNGHGDEFAWDPLDVTDPLAPVFGMYAWYRDNFSVKICKTFQGFILRYTLNLRVRHNHKYKNQGTRNRSVSGDDSDWSVIDKEQRRLFSPTRKP
jgi:hypothetical protein